MHESVIAQSIVNSVLKHANENAAGRVEIIFLKIGEITFISPDQLIFWIETGFKKTIAESCKIEIESVAAEIACNRCNYQGPIQIMDDALYHYGTPIFSCPQCNQPSIEIIHGRELFIDRIQVKN